MPSLSLSSILPWRALGACALSAFLASAGAAAVSGADAGSTSPEATAEDPGKKAIVPNVLDRKGVHIEFSATPGPRPGKVGTGLQEGDYADIEFRITGSEDGAPVRGVFPGVWLDLAKAWSGRGTGGMDCKDRVALYLQGTVGMRPMVDLNSYFILVMNKSPAISVIDPFVGITGITNLYAQINLKRPPGDWVKSADERRLFVSMPRAGQVAVVDLQRFKVSQNLKVGPNPLRVALQPDGRYLWVGTDGKPGDPGGVTVIDTETMKKIASIPTGRGHHELAFSDDNRYVYVTNREDATLSLIDIHQLEKVKDIAVGGVPLSVAYSPLSRALYLVDGEGAVLVIDGQTQALIKRLETKPGLGPLRISDDGRWALVVNTAEDRVYAIDAATNRIEHRIPVGDQPYQVRYTRTFAYVRALGTERVSMINLQDLANEKTPTVVSFPAGSKAPKVAGDLSIADGIVPAPQEAAVLVVSPGDATVYYYAEGMNAPMGAFRNYGQRPRAVTIADRSLAEEAPGVYTAKVKLPAAGTYDVAFLLETPEILHCFSLDVAPDPTKVATAGPIGVDYLDRKQAATAGDTYRLRFRLTEPGSDTPLAGIPDVGVLSYRAPAFDRKRVPAAEVEPGVYEAALPIRHAGAYYVYVGIPSRGVKFGNIPFVTLRADPPATGTMAAGE